MLQVLYASPGSLDVVMVGKVVDKVAVGYFPCLLRSIPGAFNFGIDKTIIFNSGKLVVKANPRSHYYQNSVTFLCSLFFSSSSCYMWRY